MSCLYLAFMSSVSIFKTTLLGFCQSAAEPCVLFPKQLFAVKNVREICLTLQFKLERVDTIP